jgi:hypothetical protein
MSSARGDRSLSNSRSIETSSDALYISSKTYHTEIVTSSCKRRITEMGEGNKVRSEVKNDRLTDTSVKKDYEGETVEFTRSSTNTEGNLPW